MVKELLQLAALYPKNVLFSLLIKSTIYTSKQIIREETNFNVSEFRYVMD